MTKNTHISDSVVIHTGIEKHNFKRIKPNKTKSKSNAVK